jgi:glutathione synthase
MRHLFVMDPLDRIDVRGDSTYVTMREACDRGHAVWMATPDRLYAPGGRARVAATRVTVRSEAPHFTATEQADLPTAEFDVVWMRKDPPFDMGYIFTTYLLDMAGTLVVNHPAGLKLFNEKIWAQIRFAHLQPPTLLASRLDQVRAFSEEHGRIVLKPWDGNGGRGVVVLDPGDKNLGAIVELLTREGRDHLIAQQYIPAAPRGDKRILLFDGEPVAAILRVPGATDHRANMHVGARAEACELSEADRRVCDELGPELRRHGQIFVGIDVIDGWLTEINVTSPTGLQQANRLYGRRLEAELLDRVIARAGRPA